MTLAICLVIIAFGLVLAEVAIPSFGLFSLLALGAYVWALVAAFQEGQRTGWTFVGLGIVLLPLAVALGFKLLPRTPVGKHLMLAPPDRSKLATGDPSQTAPDLVGREGVSLTNLRPAGLARIGEERVDVVAGGCFLDKNTPLRVIRVEGNRIVVEAIKERKP